MTLSRIAVTGIGVVCALGRNTREFWDNAMAGRGGIGKLDLFEAAGCLGDIAAQAPDNVVEGEARPRRRTTRRDSRTDLLNVIAACEAVKQAGLTEPLADFGVSLGTSTAGMLEAERWVRDGLSLGVDRARPSDLMRLPSSAPSDAVARRLGLRGPRLSNMTACASSAASIGFAADLIRSGDAPGMIAGGGDGLCLMTYSGFNALRLIDPKPCRPFDASRQGLTLGEGAGILVLEDWDHAMRRGARPLAEFLDYGASCDANHMTAPHPEGRGAAAAMAEALARSSVTRQDIGHINAHGTGTPMNDLAEAKAILTVFGPEAAASVPLTSTKSMIGHLLGGSGGVEAVTLVLSLRHQAAPPTLGFTTGDPGRTLNVVTGRALEVGFEYGLSNSFGFGGTNCSLVFRRAA
jgi:3-oxoacyl-[acyl-carrier-protein] synthase II